MDRTPTVSAVAQERVRVSQRESYQRRQREEGKLEEESRSNLSTLLASEKERRLRAESEVEALRQSCLEFSRLLELEKRKHKRYTPSRVDLSVGGDFRRGSVSQGESGGERDGGGQEEERSTAEQKRKVRGKEEREKGVRQNCAVSAAPVRGRDKIKASPWQ